VIASRRQEAPCVATVILATAIVTLLPRPTRAANSVGINTHIPAPEVVDLGATWIRVDDNHDGRRNLAPDPGVRV